MLKMPVNIKSCIIKEVRATITKSFGRPEWGRGEKSNKPGDARDGRIEGRNRREKSGERITEGKRESA